MANAKAKLRALWSKRPTTAEIAEIYRQIGDATNDRGAALLATTTVENALVWALMHRIPRARSCYGKLFENEGPLSTFDSKIIMGDAFAIFGPNTLHNLSWIKQIRNAFAHVSLPIRFDTSEIAMACELLRAAPDAEWQKETTPRLKFISTCNSISYHLIVGEALP